MHQMVASSTPMASGTDEALELGIATKECELIDCPRVSASPAVLECRLYHTVEIPPEHEGDTLSTLVLGRVVGIHLDPEYLDEKGRFDPQKAGLVARAAGIQYLSIENTVSIPAPFRRAGK